MDQQIVLVKIDDTSVPMVEAGVMDAGKPEHMVKVSTFIAIVFLFSKNNQRVESPL